MKIQTAAIVLILGALVIAGPQSTFAEDGAKNKKGWITLFDGTSLEHWKAVENPDTFSLKDGIITAHGPRAHLFYTGPVENHEFKNFELKVDAMTRRNSNGGIFFQTKYQEDGWPAKGFEAQVNNTFNADPRKTGSLYGLQDIMKQHVEDDAWFTEHIIVKGKRVIIKINGKKVVDWTQEDDDELAKGMRVASGTIALQGHDPGSTVHYKNIRIKPLPDN